jgi:Flp pilus assembly protein TadD
MSIAKQQEPGAKPGFFQRVGERYRWMSLRNKIGLWGLLAVLILGAVFFQWLQPAYQTTKMYFFLKLADKAVAQKNYQAASLAFRRALHSGLENPVTWKALAKFLDEIGSPEVINVWERLAKLEPSVAQYRYNQIEAALKFARVYQAEEILQKLPAAWRDAPEGLRIEAEIDINKKQFEMAEKLLARLLELRPSDKRAAFDLTCLQAASPDLSVQTTARQHLEEVAASDSEFTSAALRRLIVLEMEEGNMNEADRLAERSVGRSDATVRDRLIYAQLEAVTNSFTLALTVANLRVYANAHPADFGQIMQWFLNTRVDPSGTTQWVANLPPEMRSQPEVESALFSYYLAVPDLDRVFELIKNPQSQLHLSPKVLDLAGSALEKERTGDPSAEKSWQEAVYAAEGNAKTLRILSLLASARGWSSATGRALSALTAATPNEASVWSLLAQHETASRNLPGLYKALEGLMRINPYDVAVASNWALAASLMRQADAQEVLDVAKRTYYSTNPSDAQAATAYAMALLQAGQPAEALQVVEKMSVADRREPKRVIYVGAVLAANGRKDEALEYFTRSEKVMDNPFLEEKTLRAIWRDVAMGEATTAEEAERLLIQRNDPDVRPAKIEAELANELQRRADPSEVQRILSNLKAETESRRKSPAQLDELMREVRKEPTP